MIELRPKLHARVRLATGLKLKGPIVMYLSEKNQKTYLDLSFPRVR